MLCESIEYESMKPYMYNKVSGVRCLILNSSIHLEFDIFIEH